MEDRDDRSHARGFTARTLLGIVAAVLLMSGIALAALGTSSTTNRPRRAAAQTVQPPVLPAAAPPTVARVFAQPAATNRAAVYVPLPVSSSAPTIAGSAVAGEVLTEGHGTWSSGPSRYEYQWERCDSTGTGCQAIAQATAQTYLLVTADVASAVRVRETAINETGAGSPVSSSTTATVRPAPGSPPGPEHVAPPILGQRGIATVLSGTVRIRLKGTNTFITLTGSMSIPNGSELDATHGRVLIVVATGKPGKTARAEVSGGIFVFRQTRERSALTHLLLSLPLTGCPQISGAPATRARSSRHPHRRGPKSRRLWVSENGGHWSTTGRYVSTTVEGTRWVTSDQCNSSEVRVAVGRVRVRDLVRGTIRIVSAATHIVVDAPRKP